MKRKKPTDKCITCGTQPDRPYSSRNPALTICRNCYVGGTPTDAPADALRNIEARIVDALSARSWVECIAILHDADELVRRVRGAAAQGAPPSEAARTLRKGREAVGAAVLLRTEKGVEYRVLDSNDWDAALDTLSLAQIQLAALGGASSAPPDSNGD